MPTGHFQLPPGPLILTWMIILCARCQPSTPPDWLCSELLGKGQWLHEFYEGPSLTGWKSSESTNLLWYQRASWDWQPFSTLLLQSASESQQDFPEIFWHMISFLCIFTSLSSGLHYKITEQFLNPPAIWWPQTMYEAIHQVLWVYTKMNKTQRQLYLMSENRR